MTKVIAALNMTLDGVCDHTVGIPDEEIHYHYSNLISNSGVILYGKTTYELMQFWQTLLEKPSGEPSMDEFAVAIDKIRKIVFSSTLKETNWNTAELAQKPLDETITDLKNEFGKDILVGSRSLIIQLLNIDLIDELQICIYPMIEGKGFKLFDQIEKRIMLNLLKTKHLKSGATVFYYEPIKE